MTTNARAYQNRLLLPRSLVEAGCRLAGFDIVGHVDFMPLYSIWRTGVLKKKA